MTILMLLVAVTTSGCEGERPSEDSGAESHSLSSSKPHEKREREIEQEKLEAIKISEKHVMEFLGSPPDVEFPESEQYVLNSAHTRPYAITSKMPNWSHREWHIFSTVKTGNASVKWDATLRNELETGEFNMETLTVGGQVAYVSPDVEQQVPNVRQLLEAQNERLERLKDAKSAEDALTPELRRERQIQHGRTAAMRITEKYVSEFLGHPREAKFNWWSGYTFYFEPPDSSLREWHMRTSVRANGEREFYATLINQLETDEWEMAILVVDDEVAYISREVKEACPELEQFREKWTDFVLTHVEAGRSGHVGESPERHVVREFAPEERVMEQLTPEERVVRQLVQRAQK